jgi:hypothetical protein
MIGRPADEIADYIALLASPPAGLVQDFVGSARTSLVARGDLLVEMGDTTHLLFFVHSGLIRYMLVIPESGDDVTKDFTAGPIFA